MKNYNVKNIRKKSLFSNCEVEHLYTFKDFPIHMMKSEFDFYTDLVFDIGKEDGFIQVRNTIEGDDLYIDTHFNCLGKTWDGLYSSMAKTIMEHCNEKTDILEIGGGTGKLNKRFCDLGGYVNKWTIIEPQPCPIDGVQAEYIRGFFPNEMPDLESEYDMVVHSCVLEHADNLQSFMREIARKLKKGGIMIFAVPNMDDLLKNNFVSIMNFEHTFFITSEYIKCLLEKYGFEIINKENYGMSHSVIYSVMNTGNCREFNFSRDIYIRNKINFHKYIEIQMEKVCSWNEKLKKESRKVYLFGAHISAQYLVAYGLHIEYVEAILDNDVFKQNGAVSGIDKKIYSPSILKELEEVVVIIPNSPYKEEIKKEILDNINPLVEFWE